MALKWQAWIFLLLPLYYIEWPKNLLWWYFMNFIRDHPCMYYVITKGGGEGQKTPNHDYVIHGWSLIRIRFKKLKLCQIFPNNLYGKINKQNVRFDKKKHLETFIETNRSSWWEIDYMPKHLYVVILAIIRSANIANSTIL